MTHGIISAPQPEAVEAALEVFASGGNAVDAAVACALVQTVVDPQMCGIAGFGNAQLYLPVRGVHTTLDFHGRSPLAATPEMWEHLIEHEALHGWGFILKGRVNEFGYGAITTPRTLAGLDAMLRRLTGEARGVVFVVDACRNNPLIEADRSTELEIVAVEGAQRALDTVTLDDIVFSNRGLAQVGSLRGLSAVVFFSTEPGNVAEDGATAGKGSPFAIEFAREIRRRQSLDETFRKTAVAVNERTSGRQSPWRQGDLPFDVFIGGMRALPIP